MGHEQPTAVVGPQVQKRTLEHIKCDVVGVGVAWVAMIITRGVRGRALDVISVAVGGTA